MSVSKGREFDGGYARSTNVDALLEAKASRQIRKAELRCFFAELEHDQTGGRVPVDVILNDGRKQKKRMTMGEQERAKEQLMQALEEHRGAGNGFGVKIPRKFIRTAAAGFLDVSIMVVALEYFRRRMRQRSRRKCLIRGERYGRLSIRTIREATGLCFEVIVKALRFLRRHRLIALVWRPMVEVKRWGRLFVDGKAISLSCQEPEQSRAGPPSARAPKTETVSPEKRNEKKVTLTKNSFSGSFRSRSDAIGAFAAKFCPEHVVGTAL